MTETISVKAEDGRILAATVFLPDKPNGRAVLIASATGVKRKYYYAFAQFLAAAGYEVFTFDYRGIGDSGPENLRGFHAYMHEWGEKDITAMIRRIGEQFEKIMVVAHSVGGQIFGLSEESHRATKLVLVGSQTGYWRFWPLRQQPKLFFFWDMVLWPLSHLVGYFPAKRIGFSENLPKHVALEWRRWCASPNYLFDHRVSSTNFKKIHCPLLAYSFDDDFFAPQKAAEWLLGRYAYAKITHKSIRSSELNQRGVGHFGFFRESFKDLFWKEVLEFLDHD